MHSVSLSCDATTSPPCFTPLWIREAVHERAGHTASIGLVRCRSLHKKPPLAVRGLEVEKAWPGANGLTPLAISSNDRA